MTDTVGVEVRVEENCCVDETVGWLIRCWRCGCVRCDKLILGHDGVECCGYCVVLLPPDVWVCGSGVFVFEVLVYAVRVCVNTELHVLFPKFFEKGLCV